MSDRLKSKVALITGAGNGIGRAIALRFVEEGAKVVIADIDLAQAQITAEQCGGASAALAVGCDVTDSNSVAQTVNQALAQFARIDVVVSGAAVFTPVGPLADLSDDNWASALDVNLSGAFRVVKHTIPHLIAGGGGNIILIASQMARVANAGQAAYCATKGALVQLAKGIALDYVDEGIRANTISPGGIATNRLVQRFGDLDEAQRIWGPRHPMGRLGEVHEIANGAVFLASDESSFMTGADLLLDGGYTAW